MTAADYRHLKLGRPLMAEAIRFSEQHYPGQPIKIGAQAHLQNFYGSLGFKPTSDIYDEDGIPHLDMVRGALSGR